MLLWLLTLVELIFRCLYIFLSFCQCLFLSFLLLFLVLFISHSQSVVSFFFCGSVCTRVFEIYCRRRRCGFLSDVGIPTENLHFCTSNLLTINLIIIICNVYFFFSQQKKARLDDFKYSTSPSLNTLYAFRCLFVVAFFRMQFSICLHCKLFELRKKKYFISLVVQLNGQAWAYVWNAVNEIFKSFWSSRTFRANFAFFFVFAFLVINAVMWMKMHNN